MFLIGGARETGKRGAISGAMRAEIFLRWMEIKVDINLGLALSNATIPTYKFKGPFTI